MPILGLRDVGMERPEDEDIEKGLKKLATYFTALETLPSHSKMMEGTPVSTLRKPDGEDNILFRPIAQVALARALEYLHTTGDASLADLMNTIAAHEEQGHLRLTSKTEPWFGILCDPITATVRRQISFMNLCARMMVHLLGGGLTDPEDREGLRDKFFEARKGSTETEEPRAYDITGSLVDYDEFSLPKPWR